jgi:hypothetical protein
LKWYYWVGIAVAVVLGISTLVPVPAIKMNLIGYQSHCPFAPISTVILWVIAGIIYWFGKRNEK